MASYTLPIWKDTYITLSNNTTTGVRFRIQSSGAVIYTGTCWPRPGTTQAIVKINDICADYLSRALPLTGDDYYSATFTPQVYSGGSWSNLDTYTFVRDWSYDNTRILGTDKPVAPVTDLVHPAGYLPLFSFDGNFAASIVVGGATTSYTDSDVGNTQFLDLGDYPGWTEITANGETYHPAPLCGGFALYYINALGGWDTLPVMGRTQRSADATRYTREQVYDNRYYASRGTENYVTELQERFVLTIGPLTTEQSVRMGHLLGSTFVYLHDIAEGRVLPLVLTGGTIEHKDRAGVLHTYEVEAALAAERLRR